MAFFEYQGDKIYYVEHGSGKPIVLLHGITNSGRAWLKQIPALIALGYRVIVPDFVGHGSSSAARRVTAPSELADCILALLNSLNLTCADFCGLSLGGTVAIEAALKQPAAVNRLIIANSFSRTNSQSMESAVADWKELFLQDNGPLQRLETTWPILVNEDFRKSPQGLETYAIWHAQAAQADGTSYCNIADGLLKYDTTEKLKTIEQQTLIISSENDKISPVANSEGIASAIKNATHITLPKSEHVSNVDSCAKFNQILTDFLASDQ